MTSILLSDPWPSNPGVPFALIAHHEAVIVEATEEALRVQHTTPLRVGSRVPVAVHGDTQAVSLEARVASSRLVRITPAPLYESRLEPRGAVRALLETLWS